MGHAWKTPLRDAPTEQAAEQKTRLQQAKHPIQDRRRRIESAPKPRR